MILYYLIAGAFSLLSALTIWSYVIMERAASDANENFENLAKRLQKHGERILQLNTDLSSQKETIYLLKKNLFKCLEGAHQSSVKSDVDNNHKRKRGRPKNHS